jgi:hypothetical protein
MNLPGLLAFGIAAAAALGLTGASIEAIIGDRTSAIAESE